MTPQDLPLVGRVLAFGPDDVVYDSLIVTGPLIVALPILMGRDLVTTAIVAAYVTAFVAYLGVRATYPSDQ